MTDLESRVGVQTKYVLRKLSDPYSLSHLLHTCNTLNVILEQFQMLFPLYQIRIDSIDTKAFTKCMPNVFSKI